MSLPLFHDFVLPFFSALLYSEQPLWWWALLSIYQMCRYINLGSDVLFVFPNGLQYLMINILIIKLQIFSFNLQLIIGSYIMYILVHFCVFCCIPSIICHFLHKLKILLVHFLSFLTWYKLLPLIMWHFKNLFLLIIWYIFERKILKILLTISKLCLNNFAWGYIEFIWYYRQFTFLWYWITLSPKQRAFAPHFTFYSRHNQLF